MARWKNRAHFALRHAGNGSVLHRYLTHISAIHILSLVTGGTHERNEAPRYYRESFRYVSFPRLPRFNVPQNPGKLFIPCSILRAFKCNVER